MADLLGCLVKHLVVDPGVDPECRWFMRSVGPPDLVWRLSGC